MLILHKVLPLFFLPLGLGILTVMFGPLFRKRFFVWAGIALLWFFGAPLVGDFLIRQIEGVETRVAVDSLDGADAVVVLGGVITQVPGVRYGEWGNTVDRFDGGVEVFSAGKAPLLIFMGSKRPWMPDEKPEGEILAERAKRLGIPETAILVTGKVGNTADEAKAARGILSRNAKPHVILVTSAFHMKRATLLFRKAGMKVQPFPVDFRGSYYKELTLIDFLPGAKGLENSEIAIREVLGILYYRIFGG